MEKDNTFWWVLQLQLLLKSERQLNLFPEEFIPRSNLIEQALEHIPKHVRIMRHDSKWGLANLERVHVGLYTFKLFVRPPFTLIAEEPKPGVLDENIDPRYFTTSVLHLSKQMIVVQKSSDVSRYARSAKTFAEIYKKLFQDAIALFKMDKYYEVEVEPIAKFGSFVEWINSIDKLKKIVVKYSGQNLPAGPGNLVSEIKNTASQYMKVLNSKDVELAANEPKLDNEQIVALDAAVAGRKLKLRAHGIKESVSSSWSSSDKPVPESLMVDLTPEQLSDTTQTAQKISKYIQKRFHKNEDKNE